MSDTQGHQRLTVYSDYVCPFCYLGRQALDRYQDERSEPLVIDWHPFDLRAGTRGPDGRIDPDADDGKGDAYYERARENVRRLAETYDVDLAQEIARGVDSRPAQVVSHWVQANEPYERWLAFDRGLFAALWVDGRDIGDVDIIGEVAAAAGLEAGAVRSAVDDPAAVEAVEGLFAAARERGITGVPTFAYGDHTARGAVPPAQLRRLVEGV
jgi:predicted DsbA family dithiol-disulfide isomerase